MNHILLVGHDRFHTEKVIQALKPDKEIRVHKLDDLSEAQHYLSEDSIDLLVVELPYRKVSREGVAEILDEFSESFPVVILGPSKEYDEFRDPLKFPNIHIYSEPIKVKTFRSFIRRVLEEQKVPHQIYRRYPTREMASIEIYGQGDRHIGQVKNLSQGGAYVEWISGSISFQEGDLLRMTVNLKMAGKKHNLNAEVVWTRVKDSEKQVSCMGVHFINSDELYDKLLNRL